MRSTTVLAKRQIPTKAFNRVHHHVCQFCPSGCGISSFFNNDTLVDIFGDAEHPLNKGSVCPKVFSLYTVCNHPQRLEQPCIRPTADAPWKSVSWDEAFAFIRERTPRTEEAVYTFFGKEHVPFDCWLGAQWATSVIENAYGPDSFLSTALGKEGKLAAMFGTPAGELCMNTQRDWAKSKVILLVGGDTAAHSPITFGPIEDARDRGSTLLYLGTTNGMTARRADIALLVRPGTERIALAAIMRILLQEGRIDTNFIAASTTGLDQLQRAVSNLSMQQAAALCGTDANQILQVARSITQRKPLQVQPSPLLDDDALALCGALVSVCGSIGKPGCGLNMQVTSPFRNGALFSSTPNKGAVSPYTALTRQTPGVIIGIADWATTLPGGSVVRQAVQKSPCIVHIGCFANTSRELAHVSLPAAHWSEYDSLVDVSSSRTLQWSNALFMPPEQCRPPLDIWTDMVACLGSDACPPWLDQKEDVSSLRQAAGFALSTTKTTQGITLTSLDTSQQGSLGGIQWPCSRAEDAVFENNRYVQGTIRGRNILYATVQQQSNTVCVDTNDGKIHLEAVTEPLLQDTTTELALILSAVATQHVAATITHTAPQTAYVILHPETAHKRNISNNDKVTVYNDNGSIESTVLIHWSGVKNAAILHPDIGSFLYYIDDTSLTTVQIKRMFPGE